MAMGKATRSCKTGKNTPFYRGLSANRVGNPGTIRNPTCLTHGNVQVKKETKVVFVSVSSTHLAKSDSDMQAI